MDELAAFRKRHHGQPILVAGGVTAHNVWGLIAASGTVGVDVCSSMHRDGDPARAGRSANAAA